MNREQERQVNIVITWQGSRWGRIQVEIATPGWTGAWLQPGASGPHSGGLLESGLPAKQVDIKLSLAYSDCSVIVPLSQIPNEKNTWKTWLYSSTRRIHFHSFIHPFINSFTLFFSPSIKHVNHWGEERTRSINTQTSKIHVDGEFWVPLCRVYIVSMDNGSTYISLFV